MSLDGLFDSVPPLAVGDSPPAGFAGRVAEASGGVETTRDRKAVGSTAEEVGLETVVGPNDIHGKSEYEGKRPADLFEDFEQESDKKPKSVTFMKPSPSGNARLTRVTWLQKPTCSKYCLAALTPKGGLPKFCVEVLSDGKCSLKTHAEKTKFDPVDGLYVLSETTSGRGGATAYATKFIPEDLFEEEDQIDAIVAKEKTVKDWDEFIRCFKLSKATRNEVLSMEPSLTSSGVKILQECYTPQKAVRTRKVEDDTTILDTPDSWEEVFTSDSLGNSLQDPLADQPRDHTSVVKLANFANKGFGICRDNFNMVSDSMDSLGGKARSTFSEAFDKLNKITVILHALKDQVGTYTEIDDVEGIATVFEILSLLDGKIGLNGKNLTKLGDDVVEAKKRIDEVELIKSDIDQKTEAIEQTAANLTKRTSVNEDLITMIKQNQKTMVTSYLEPFSELYNQLKARDMSGCNFLERVARMEQTVSRISDDKDLFGNISMTGLGDGAAGEDLSTTLNRVSMIESENAHLKKELDDIKDTLKAMSSNGGHNLGNVAEDIIERVTVLEEYRGPGITISGIRFDGPGACEQFLRSQLAWDNNKPFFGNDWVSIVHSIPKEDGAVTIEALMARDHHTTKGGFSNLSAAKAYASAQQSVPGMLAGTAEHPIPGVKTFDKYDHQDGLKGVRYEITRGVDNRGNALMSLMQRDLRTSPTALAVFTSLVLNSQIHWKTFAAFLSDLRNVTYHQCHDATEAWLYACEVGRGVFDECYKLRNVGSERSNMKEFTVQDAARLMWGMLQTYDLMEEFIKYKFLGHPNLASYSINHLFRNRVTPNSLSTVKGELQKGLSKLSALENTIGKHEQKIATLGRNKKGD